jgi:hypothetical protein
MATGNTPNQHVHQVAKLVRLLSQGEIRQLMRLVPQLQAEQEVVADERESLVRWAREQMAPYEHQTRPMQDEDEFLGGMSLAAYFNLPEAERERIWNELYSAAIEAVEERQVNSDAVLPSSMVTDFHP